MVAFRYLRSRRTEGFISVITGFSFLGITLGVGTLIVVLAVMDGFRHELLSRILGLNGHMLVQSKDSGLSNYISLTESIRKINGVKSVTPIIDGQVMAVSKNRASGALVRGISLDDLNKLDIVSKNIISGSMSALDQTSEVILGARLAQNLKVVQGSTITLLSPQTTATAFGTMPRARANRVAAIFNVGMFEYDSSYIFMPLPAAQLYFRYGKKVAVLEVRLEDPDAINQARKSIVDIIGNKESLTDWQQLNSGYFNALKVERNVMFLILTLIILVAAFNIVSGLIMLVKEKSRDIAILRTIGVSRMSIMRIFFIAGATVGVAGTLVGSMLGIVFAYNISAIQSWLESLTGVELFAAEIYFLSRLPANVVWADVGGVVLMSLSLSLLATLYPSWRAARLDPIKALRYE